MRLAVGRELAVDVDIAKVDPLVDSGDTASWQCNGLALGSVNLTLTENAGGLCFVSVAWARIWHEPHVRADVTRARHGKCGDKGGICRLTVGNPAVDLNLPCCVALVVAVDDGVLGAEGGRMNSVPVNESDFAATATHVQCMAFRVDSVGEATQLFFRVTLKCLQGAVDTRILSNPLGQVDSRRLIISVCTFNSLDHTDDYSFESDGTESKGSQVNHEMARRTTRRNMRVRCADKHVALMVEVSEESSETPQNFHLDGLEHEPHICGDVDDTVVVVIAEDECTRHLAKTQTRGGLIHDRIPVHASAEWLACHIGHSSTDIQIGGRIPRSGRSPVCRSGVCLWCTTYGRHHTRS